MPDLPDAPWITKNLPDAPWAVEPKPTAAGAPPKSDSYFGLIPVAKAIYHGVVSGATLPGDVYSGRVPITGEDGRTNPEVIKRALDTASLATPINPAVRAGDAAIPGVAKALIKETPATPTTAELRTAEDTGFNAAKNMDVDIAPSAIRDVGSQIEQKLQGKGILEEHAPITYKTLERLKEPPEGSVATISDLHNLRQAFGNAAGNINYPKDTLAGSIGKEALDKYLSAIPEKDILAGPAAAASAKLKDAIGNSAAAFRAEDVGARLTRAERQAARSGSGSNIDNAIRQKISAVLDVPSRTRGFSPEELAQMETVVRGTGPANIMRKIGKLGVSDGLSLLLHAGAAAGSGGMTLPIAVAGTVARKVAEALTQKQANILDEMIRARSPLAQSQQPTIRSLTGGEQARRAMIARALLESRSH